MIKAREHAIKVVFPRACDVPYGPEVYHPLPETQVLFLIQCLSLLQFSLLGLLSILMKIRVCALKLSLVKLHFFRIIFRKVKWQ